ncbi:MAG: hypothetical protein H6668_07185 [Ardenticatenaceae bacterium]|nr:hypothetical protein [Ardenticatenaceae bacterium]
MAAFEGEVRVAEMAVSRFPSHNTHSVLPLNSRKRFAIFRLVEQPDCVGLA